MANDKGKTNKVKDDENTKSKKKTATPDASPASSSRRSSRETSSGKQTNESPIKENLINTRKSVRLENKKPSGPTPTKEKSEKTRGQAITTPTKTNDRRKKLDAGNSPVSPATSSLKSKKEKDANGGRKRKRVGTSRNKGVSESPQVRTEEGDDGDKESEETLSDASSSSREVEKLDSSKSAEEDKDDSADSNGEGSPVEASKRQRTSDQEETLNDGSTGLEQDRTPCEATALARFSGMPRTDTSTCIACKKLRCYQLPLVKESIWDTREVEATEAQGSHKQKQYFVKYKGHAHIHNQWIPESQLLLEAPLLVEYYINGLTKWNEEWTVPHQVLKKRSVLSLKPVSESEENTVTVLNYHHEWLVQWQGLDYEQATWESENITVLDSPDGHNLVKDYENNLGSTKKDATLDNDKIEEITLKLPAVFAGCPPGTDSIQVNYAKNLHDVWTKGQNSIVFDDQERTLRIVLFILSLESVSMPFLLITRSNSLSLWEAMFSKIAPNVFQVSLEETNEKTSYRLIHVQKEGGELVFQLLLLPVDAVVKDLGVLKAIEWEAVIVDESQSSDISSHFSQIKSLSTEKRLLIYCGPLGVSNLDVMSLLDCDVISKTELADISKLKETLSKLIAYECKPNSSKFVEYWVPVQISNAQLEQYCSLLLSNAMALTAYSKSDTFGALHEILVSIRKCCDHPYIVDQSLQAVLTKDLELVKFLDVGIKASGKLQFLDLILPEMRKRQLRVLIVFQPLSGSGKDATSIGDILDDFVRQRFGEDSYERVDGIGMIPSKKQAALNNFNNKEMGRFIFLLEHRACLASIKLSSIDTIILFDSDWNPANDLRALQRIAIDSRSEQIMTFRLYTSSTLEEKVLRLAGHNVTIDSKLQNLSRSTSDELLMWGATYLFKKLDEFHSDLNVSSEEGWWNELREEFLDLISYKSNKDEGDLKITKAKPVDGTYGKNVTLPNKVDREQHHAFWKKLLAGRDPCWKYLSKSNSRQRTVKRPQYLEVSPKKTVVNNDDVGRSKRKKITNNVVEPVAPKPVEPVAPKPVEPVAPKPVEPVAPKPVEPVAPNPAEPVAPKPAEPVAPKPAEPVSPKSAETVAPKPVTEEQGEMSFQDCLKLKVSKLCAVLGLSEDVKIMVENFLIYVIENYRVNKEPKNTLHAFLLSLCWIGAELLKHKLDKKLSISLAKVHLNFSCTEEEADSVYLKLESAKDAFLHHIKNDTKTGVSTDTIPEVRIEVSDIPPNQFDDNHGGDCNQKDGEVAAFNPDMSDAQEQNNDNSLVPPLVSPALGQSVSADLVNESNFEASLVQSHEEPRLPSENQSNVQIGEQAPDSKIPLGSVSSEQLLNKGGLSQLSGKDSGNGNQGVSLRKSGDPLQAELERLCELRSILSKCHDSFKQKLKSDHEKELAETIAQINAKYEAKNQETDASYQSKTKEIETSFSKVVMNKVLAETYRSKSQAQTPFHYSEFQGGTTHRLPQFHGQARSNGVTSSSSPAQSVRSQQVTEVQPPLQIVNQPSQLFSTALPRAPSNTNPSTMPTRPPPSTVIPTNTPNKPPSIHTSTPSKPPFTAGLPSRPPPSINHMTPSGRYSRPPPNIIPTPPSARNVRATEVRAPAPHLRPFRPSSMPASRMMPSQRPSNMMFPLSQTSGRPPSSQTPPPPPFPTNHNNSQPIQNSPRSLPTSSQPPSTSATTHNSPRSLPTSSQPPSTSVPVAPPPSGPVAPPTSFQPPPPSVPVAPPTSVPVAPPSFQPPPTSVPVTPATSVPVAPPTSFQPPPASVPVAPPASFQPSPTSMPMPMPMPVSPPTSFQPSPTSMPMPVAPPTSYQLPSYLYAWYPPGTLPATLSSHPQVPLPPMPPVSISHTGLYNPADILSRPALDLLTDIDKQGGLHPPNTSSPAPPEVLDLTAAGKGGGSDLVCLSDDEED